MTWSWEKMAFVTAEKYKEELTKNIKKAEEVTQEKLKQDWLDRKTKLETLKDQPN